MTVTVTMLQTRRGEDGNLWTTGSEHEATDAFAALLIGSNLATGTLPEVPQSAFTVAQQIALRDIAEAYSQQPTTWYSGEIASTVTPTITADGNLATATDQVPIKWLAVINADDDVDAAQRLLDGGPNVVEILPGAHEQLPNLGTDGDAEIITTIHAVCISSAAAPADYTGGAYILSDADTDLADALANMARFDFSGGLGATVARFVASQVYDTNFAQLSVAAGVVA